MTQPVVISCFDLTTTFVKPWADAGCLCYCVDMQNDPGETREGNIVRVGADMLDWLPPVPSRQIVFAAFWPPCTDVAVSGARWFRDKGLGRIARSLALFKRSVDMAELIGCPYIIENPVSTVSTYWRKPDHTFDPCDYGDPYTKKTCLWSGGGFVMPLKNRVEPLLGSMMHKLPPSAERANLRSATPEGFTRAAFDANRHSISAPQLAR